MTVLEFPPESMTWSLAWDTDILEADDGTEHRVQNARDPRERLQLEYLLGPNGVTESDLFDVRRILFNAPADAVEVPNRYEGAPVTAAITGTTVAFDRSLLDWTVGGPAVWIENLAGEGYRAEVTSYPTGSTVTVDTAPPVGQTYAAGTTRIYPLISLYLDDGQGLAWHPSSTVGRFTLAGQRSDFRATWGTGAALSTLSALTLLDRRPDNADTAQERILGGFTRHDQGGAISNTYSRTIAKIARSHSWTFTGAAERQWFKKLLGTVKGQQKTFLLPTWRSDLTVFAQPNVGDATLKVDADDGYRLGWWPSLAHRWIQLERSNGSIVRHAVTGVADGGDGSDVLTVSPTLGGGSITKVSLVERCRFGSDQFTWTVHPNADRATLSAEVLVVQQ